MTALRVAVDDLIAARQQWTVLRSRAADGSPLVAEADLPLHCARWPRFDQHVAVVLAYAGFDGGRPCRSTLEQLEDFSDRLVLAAGRDGALVAFTTGANRQVLHFYVDSATTVGQRLIDEAPGWPGGARVLTHLDPSMAQVAEMTF